MVSGGLGPAISGLVFCLLPLEMPAAEYVGRDSCMQCHAEQVKLCQGSHHDLAMLHAIENAVLGDFSDTAFTYVYAVALNSTGNSSFAIDVLQDAQIRFPQDS